MQAFAQGEGLAIRHGLMHAIIVHMYIYFLRVDQQAWQKAVQHVLGVEQGYWESDAVMKEVLDPFIVDMTMDIGSEDEEGVCIVSPDEN